MTGNGHKVSGLDAHLGYWLRYVSNAVSHAFQQKLQARGVTVAECVVLREMLGRGETAPSALADRLRMTRGAISKLAERLLDKDLIARRDDGGDARRHTLRLTAKGSRLVPALAALADANDSEFFGHLSAGDRATLAETMQDIVRRRGLTEIPTR